MESSVSAICLFRIWHRSYYPVGALGTIHQHLAAVVAYIADRPSVAAVLE